MTHLKEGDAAPDFSVPDQNGNIISLKDLRGKHILLYFYPKANTPGCTAESCNLRDNYQDFIEKGFAILGVSADTPKAQLNFKEKYELPFPLIPDVEKTVIQAYGVWGKKKMYGREYEGIHRLSFIISPDGIIEKIFTKVKTKDHSNQVFKEYETKE